MMMKNAKRLLWLDSGAGCTVGTVVLTLHEWLSELWGFQPELVLVLGAANLGYGCYSGSLARRAWRDMRVPILAIDVLVIANLAWAIICLVLMVLTWEISKPLGVAQLALEAVFVGGLGLVERRVVRPEAGQSRVDQG